MDRIDRHILRLLQEDATLSLAQISATVGLSPTPCWKRIQRLEAEGVIKRRVALLDPERLGLGVTAIVMIEVEDHSEAGRENFARAVASMPEVLDLYRMAGETDYLLRAILPDMAAYDAFYRRLAGAIPLKSVTARFALERVKATTALPLTHLDAPAKRRLENPSPSAEKKKNPFH